MKSKIALLAIVLLGTVANIQTASARVQDPVNNCSISQHVSPDGRFVSIIRYCEGGGLELLDIIPLY